MKRLSQKDSLFVFSPDHLNETKRPKNCTRFFRDDVSRVQLNEAKNIAKNCTRFYRVMFFVYNSMKQKNVAKNCTRQKIHFIYLNDETVSYFTMPMLI